MIDQATIDKILDTAQIVDVVSEFVTLRKRGVNYIGLCPFHSERTPSFSVSPSKGICKCFSCGKGGNVVHFIMEHEQLTYVEALKWLAKKYGIEIKEKELTAEEKQYQSQRESMLIVNQFAAQFFQSQVANEGNNAPTSEAILYFRSRGFRDDIIKKFQLGFCPKCGYALSKEALKKGYKREYLLDTGLCYAKDDGRLVDRFWGRVIFPIHSLSGKIVGFGGRVLNAQTKGVNMKYVNSPESEVYHKSRELYGIYFAKHAIVKCDKCYLVEGYTDVISMHQSGVENVVASSGTALTKEQIRLIHRFTGNVTILYDGDCAGIKASLRGIDMFLEEGMNIKVCLIPDGDDPDSFARKHNATEFQQFIGTHEVDFIRFKTNLGKAEAGADPTKRVELVSSIVKSISVIPDSIARAVYTRECSVILDMEERVLVEAVGKLLKEESYKQRQQVSQVGSEVSRLDTEAPLLASGTAATTDNRGTSADSVSYIPKEGNENKVFFQQEQALVQLIIRYGDRVMCMLEDEVGEEKPLTVTECISMGLQEDGLQFHDALHREILNEAAAHIGDASFKSEHYFMTHPNASISRLTAEMIEDKYQLSKYHYKGQKIETDEERLYEIVPRLLIDFKLSIVKEEMTHVLHALADPAVASDAARCKATMERYQELQQIQSMMAKHAGDRVVCEY